ncbi:FMN-binding glutamate synthase family protein [Pseudoxanthomonas sp. SGNA-20]|uniref:FMN-binding glutamate synthase family protein n=1 Tax=unclassified Pseudoxanthomonas TaxID=2645906 RepID=UPI00031AB754|nr:MULTISPECIES: FMN-binding glutamate synthase family protein [unclassified Pseudoxanthomonas]RRN54803.1 FMN-binding glutamate synthase family protein [Pseudoxanthomonas sp. SGNA-20]RRN78386.1 FMN-binding glutamate synthase family protein [Pseudoxanthomonas sp. SGD-10]
MHRYLGYAGAWVLLLVSIPLALRWPSWGWGAAIGLVLVALGTLDLLQKRSTLRRNYPLLAWFRYGLESVGPEIRQYFVEADTDEVPFSRQQRALVYRRAKNVMDVVPFGTLQDAYATDYEWINHSLAPTRIADHDFRITVGPDAAQPYRASVFNISAMSFGSLSANAIRALNEGARRGGFYHDTGEGSISPYHLEPGGDLVWELGSGYFGCRDGNGRFDPERFAEQAARPQVRMIEVKLSQGAKPGHGGVLPAAKVSAEIAATRGVPMGADCVSPSSHPEFDTPLGLLQFVARLRELSGGKPVGFKLAIGHPWEWFAVAKAMHESGLLPDFIVVDGAEGGTGAAPVEFMDHIGVPMHEGLMLVHNTLVGLGLRQRIRLAGAGRITSAFDIARTLAMGADWCNAGRAFMFALGCIQSLSCHTDRCPTGIATQNPRRWRNLDPQDKATRVYQFHLNTVRALRDLLCAAGLNHPSELGPEHILRRVSPTEIRSLAALYHFLEPGELLHGTPSHAVFRAFWADADPRSFGPPPRLAALRSSKSR